MSMASDIWGPNYSLHLLSDSQFSVYTTVISLNPLCFLVGCIDHVHLIDGETDRKKQDELLKVTQSQELYPGATDSKSHSHALDK